jgi:hypothetical protein
MRFRLLTVEYDRRTERAYVAFEYTDPTLGISFTAAMFAFKNRPDLTNKDMQREVVARARSALKSASLAI